MFADREFSNIRVVGVTFKDRQSVVADLSVGEEVFLEREPDNYYDHNAIKVVRENGQSFGYLNRMLALELSRGMDTMGKTRIPAQVVAVTGGHDRHSYLGAQISFTAPVLETIYP